GFLAGIVGKRLGHDVGDDRGRGFVTRGGTRQDSAGTQQGQQAQGRNSTHRSAPASGLDVPRRRVERRQEASAMTQASLALSRPKALSWEPGTVRKPTLTRFHALIAMTTNDKSEISFSDSWVRTRS